MKEIFLQLVRLGIGVCKEAPLCDEIDWTALQALAEEQGLLGVGLDGIDMIPKDQRPQKKDIIQWIGMTIQQESRFVVQQKAAAEMALQFHQNSIKSYVLKGVVIAECYPNPIHRRSSDFDCFLLPSIGDFDAWELGNELIKTSGFKVEKVFYKNSTFFLPGLTVENHRFLTPFRGNKKLKALEIMLQEMLRKDEGKDQFEGAWLYRPPVMVSSLFIIEHAYSHFLHEGLAWRHVLDWMMFREKHLNEINWNEFDAFIDRFGFRQFYDTFFRLGKYLLGKESYDELSQKDRRMLEDIWAPLDLHETARGIKGKINLAGNTWRARWKYRYFGDVSMIHALWIQIKGVLFERHPQMDEGFL